MRTHFIGGTIAAALTIAGCSSVDQVPLVYVSTVKVGVNVESGSAETPGAKLMIGVDATDAAYVPVAVSRYCRGDTLDMMRICAEQLAKIEVIRGNVETFSAEERQKLDQFAKDASYLSGEFAKADKEYSDALAREAAAAADLASSMNADNLVATLIAAQEARSNQALSSTEQDQLTKAKNDRELMKQRRDALKKAQDDRGRTLAALDEKRDELSKLIAEVRGLLPSVEKSQQNQGDALSVVGTFTGDIKGSGESGGTTGVKLGKSFSTGIAAQNLSDGLADRERENAKNRPACIKAVGDSFAALPGDQKSASTLKELLARCD